MAISKKALRQELSRHYLKEGIYGTASSGSTTTLADTSNASPFNLSDDENKYVDAWLAMITVGTGSNAGLERRITAATVASKLLTCDAFPSAIASGDTYEVHKIFSKADWDAAITRALTERLYFSSLEPLTEVADGSMESSGVSSWTGVAATPTKSTTDNQVQLGVRALVNTADGTSDPHYIKSASITVRVNDSRNVEVLVRPVGSSIVTLQAWDETNAAAITIVNGETSVGAAEDGTGWFLLYGSFQIPTGCKSIHYRLVEATASAVSYWDDLHSWNPNVRVREIPDLLDGSSNPVIDGPNKVRGLWRREGKQPDEWRIRKCGISETFLNRLATRGPTVEIDEEDKRYPLYIEVVKHYADFTSETDTTTAPPLWLKYAVLYELLKPEYLAPTDKNKKVIGTSLRRIILLMNNARMKAKDKYIRLGAIPLSMS